MKYCLQSSFGSIVNHDLEENREIYSQKVKDLLYELKTLSKLDSILNYRSIVVLYERLDDLRRHLQLHDYSDVSYWMETPESTCLLSTVDEEVFGVLDQRIAEEEWMNPPPKWEGLCTLLREEEEKAIQEMEQAEQRTTKRQPSKKTILITVWDGKAVADIHNFLTAPARYLLVCLQHALCRHISYQSTATNSRESKLLIYLRNRLQSLVSSSSSSSLKKGSDHAIATFMDFLSVQDVEEKMRSQESVFPVLHRTNQFVLLNNR